MNTEHKNTPGKNLLLRAVAVLSLAALLLITCCAARKTSAALKEMSGSDTAVLSSGQPCRKTETPMGEPGTWSLYIYMCGADLESDGGMASINLMQIMKAVPGDKVNVIVQTGGASSWGNKVSEKGKELLGISDIPDETVDVSPDVLQRYRVTDHMELLEELPLASMGAEDTFYDFLKWGVENYPAEHMGVVLWDHGGAGTDGVCVDELFDNDSLLPFELNEAFQRLYPDMTDRFEFIGFDACLMSTIEVANAISPFARYMYASEETIPGYGWPYADVVRALNEAPAQNGEALGKNLCDSYRSFYARVDENDGGSTLDVCTLAVTDMEKVNGVVEALDALGKKLEKALDRPEELKAVTLASLQTEGFAYPYMLDLGSLAENLEGVYPKEAKALKEAVSEAVVYSVHGAFSADSTGMAIYYPKSSTIFTDSERAREHMIVRYALCAPSASYYDFVKELQFRQYRASKSGVPTVRVREEPHLEDVDEENVKYSMTLNPEDLDKIAEMRYQIWLLMDIEVPDESGKTQTMTSGFLLGSSLGVEYDQTTGEVSDDFDDSWKWVTLNGVPLEMNIESYDDETVLYSSPIRLNEDRTQLMIRWTKATDQYEIIGTYTGYDEETGQLSRQIYPLKEGDVITPRYEVVMDELIQGGMAEYPLLGLGGSTYCDMPEFATTYSADTKPERTALEDGEYYLQYYITDIYGSRQAFAPLEFTMQDGEAYVDTEE